MITATDGTAGAASTTVRRPGDLPNPECPSWCRGHETDALTGAPNGHVCEVQASGVVVTIAQNAGTAGQAVVDLGGLVNVRGESVRNLAEALLEAYRLICAADELAVYRQIAEGAAR